MNKFGNIPEEILDIPLPDILDEEPKTLREMIEEVTKENIIDAKFNISCGKEGLTLNSFLAWTNKEQLKLTITSNGCYVIKL